MVAELPIKDGRGETEIGECVVGEVRAAVRCSAKSDFSPGLGVEGGEKLRGGGGAAGLSRNWWGEGESRECVAWEVTPATRPPRASHAAGVESWCGELTSAKGTRASEAALSRAIPAASSR